MGESSHSGVVECSVSARLRKKGGGEGGGEGEGGVEKGPLGNGVIRALGRSVDRGMA